MVTIPPVDLATATPTKMNRIKSLLGITALVNALTGKKDSDVTRATDFTAVKGGSYVTVGTLVVTDPVGAAASGDNFCVQVENGDATVGGTVYAPGTFVKRVYYGTWTNRVYYDLTALTKAQRAALAGAPLYADLAAANLAIGVIGIPFFNIADDEWQTTTNIV